MKKTLFMFVLMALLLVMVAGCAPGAVVQVNTPVPTTKAGTPVPGGQIVVPGVNIQIDAPGPNSLANTPDARGRVAGILSGIWHGIISPVTIVISFVNSDVQMYEVHNDGSPYDLGFFLGVLIFLAVLSMIIGSRR